MSVLQVGISGDEQYTISRSLRFNSADSAYLNRTPSAGDRKTWTWSGWVKRSVISTNQYLFSAFNTTNQNQTNIQFGGNVTDDITVFSNTGGVQQAFIASTAVHRDVSSWYHVVVAWDTTQATASNRIKIYINGTQVTALSQSSYPSQNYDGHINTAAGHAIGAAPTPSALFNGYLTETYFIDGQALTPSSFGETDAQTGVWKPKKYTGTYGTNGFYLNFSDNSGTTSTTLGKDSSGNGNNWTPNNFSVTAGAGNDSLVDTPTPYGTDTGVGGEVRGNYCTLNPLSRGGFASMTNGNLEATISTSGTWANGTIAVSSGKYYFECVLGGATAELAIGISPNGANAVASLNVHYYSADGKVYINNVASATGATFTAGDVIGVAFEPGGEAKFYKNNTLQATVTMPSGSDWCPEAYQTANRSNTATFNFGQRPFAYTAPSGFKALCTTNLPTPTIGATSTTQAGKYFSATLWAGDGNASRSITGFGLQPDLLWVKNRTVANFHQLHDAVRGASAGMLASNSTNAEDSSYPITSFNTDGFTTKSGAQDGTNNSGSAFVGWAWNAGGSTVTNTAGTITSQVRANTTAGFSIVTYTGTGANATVGHGLGVAPSMIIIKNRSEASNWPVYSTQYAANQYTLLNTTGAVATATDIFNGTSATSTVFSVGTSQWSNKSGNGYVAYVFVEVASYSRFGSFSANGAADNAFVFTGFLPRYVLIKRTDSTSNWTALDTVRQNYNALGPYLNPNLADAETTGSAILDACSNGFKVRTAISGTWIYAAFATSPFKYSLAQ